jgi:hypothetical protein
METVGDAISVEHKSPNPAGFATGFKSANSILHLEDFLG